MGLQAAEKTSPKDGNPVFLVDQKTGGMTTAHWAAVQGVSFLRKGASIAFKTVEGSCGISRVVARASVAVGVCVLWLFIEAAADNGLCSESNTRAQAFVAADEMGRKIAQPNAVREKSLLVPRVVETMVVEQKQILERCREKIDTLAERLTPIQ